MREVKESVQKDKYRELTMAYASVFKDGIPLVEVILRDLARFCRANQTTFNADARMHAVLEGRREVWLRIQEYKTLSVEELLARHAIQKETN